MSTYLPMPTTTRHNNLTSGLSGNLFEYIKKQEVVVFQEECALVHWGSKREVNFTRLVDLNEIHQENFIKRSINELEYVMPDIIVFYKNKFITNEVGTRIAGIPDLIIEVWSESNDNYEKEFKLNLYKTGGHKIEHWYIQQDSNIVEVYIGENKLPNKNMSDILTAQNGLNFDLRYLAIKYIERYG